MPYAYHMYRIFEKLGKQVFDDTYGFAMALNDEMCIYFNNILGLAIYVAGFDIDSAGSKLPFVYLIENNSVVLINRGINGNIVYNYHTIGHSYWINRLLVNLLPDADIGEDDNNTNNNNIDIDFSKFSLEEAADFAIAVIDISRTMDSIAHLKRSIGNSITLTTMPIYGEISMINL